jgi:polysaccharide export outer membrane protein
LLLALALGGALAAEAQVPVVANPGSSVRTRAELETLLAEYEQALASPAYSEGVKRGIRADAQQVRDRLRNGDFRVGDRIALYVQGEAELPDTVVVEAGPTVTLPLFGQISLTGVLRSEISGHLTTALSRFIRDPVVRANALMRLAVVGEVARPGFYTMPAEILVGEALMVAGGPTSTAEIDDLRIDRGADRLLEGEEMREAVREGLTLDQLNLQAGDQIIVPGGGSGSTLAVIGVVAGLVGSLSILIVQLF